ncbi:ABC transporter substrate-binding protein [Kribbella kalugense]|uniref:Carbohydrate ABC transporter substrate-binding protein (CUT1 family) n=1 Tax=Kribbella kalugense TaxID=2512221 RepID=A0A4R8A217_9ACTN|nr:extracellular solute-binding protein [Kribbella kalugense]TDW24256.1 carbohydrate ABC transporter substrate-binding protein (CUT1 family) [Kribbella kalugense]
MNRSHVPPPASATAEQTPRGFSRRSVLTALAGISLTVAGCAPGGNDKSSASSSSGKSSVTLNFWHYFTDRAELLQQFADQYHDQTGVTVKLQLIPGDTLGQKFQAAAQAGRLPDVAAGWTGVGDGLAPYAKQGTILNLQAAMNDGWSQRFYPAHLQAGSFQPGNSFGVPPGPYLVPLDANNMQILYNTKHFAKAGISAPPATFADFLDASAKLATAGVVPFTSGFASWPLDSFAQMYQYDVIGADAMDATFSGKRKYTDPAWLDFLGLFQQLRESKALAQGILAADMPAAESLFANGQAGMIFDGSWAVGVFKQKNPGFTDYDVMLPPSVGGATGKLAIPGGVGAQLLVVGTSPHKDEAVKFVRWLTDPDQQVKYATTSANLPANREVAGKISTTPVLQKFAAEMDKVFPSLPHSMPAAVNTSLHAGLQNILAGKSAPAAVAAALQHAQSTGQAK